MNVLGTEQPVMLDHALAYLAAGLPVWPVCVARIGGGCVHGRGCKHPGKYPLVR
jgi:hypothetical protein